MTDTPVAAAFHDAMLAAADLIEHSAGTIEETDAWAIEAAGNVAEARIYGLSKLAEFQAGGIIALARAVFADEMQRRVVRAGFGPARTLAEALCAEAGK